MSSGRRYLVVGPAWVGDMVMAQSLFMTVKQKDPEATIDVLASAWSVPLLARMPEVNEAITVPVSHGELGLGTRWSLGRHLRQRRYDHALVLPRSYKSALIPFFAGARRRTGYRGEMRYGLLNDIRKLDKAVLKQTVQRYVALGLDADAPLPPGEIPQPHLHIDRENQARLLKQLDLSLERPIIGMMPGAEYGPAKCWPAGYFSKLAASLHEKNRQVWVFGSENEKVLGERIRAAAPGVRNLCGKTRLEDAVDLIALTEAVVSNDSGLMHVACATESKVVAIYGSSDPSYTPPLSDKAKVVYLGLECSPCFKRQCPLGHTDCLNKITPEKVETELANGNEHGT